MRLLYVTSSFPYGEGEGFLVPELRELERQGHEVTIVPALARGRVVHRDAGAFLPDTRRMPLLSPAVVSAAARVSLASPASSLRELLLLRRSQTPSILAKNLAVLPKALWLAALARKLEVAHIHAHWGGTSGTLAMVAGRLARVPWSLTVHRWDIREDNLLARKVQSAAFVRAISRDGLRDLRRVAGPASTPTLVIHMGIDLPARVPVPVDRAAGEPFRILVAANLLEVKGHKHLVEAAALLRSRGVRVLVGLAGEGPLRAELAGQIAGNRLEGECVMLGQLDHADLLGQLAAGRWDAVALASIVTERGEKEGIPVALLEAMSYGLPVVGTAAGAVPELLGSGAGILVPPGDPAALAAALEQLARDRALRARIGGRGRELVEREFDVTQIVRELGSRFEQASRPRREPVQTAGRGRSRPSRAGS